MAKRVKNSEDEISKKDWREGELIDVFNLNRIIIPQTALMQEWLDVTMPELNVPEAYSFDKYLTRAQKQITGWQEEDLKMKFISPILELGNLMDSDVVLGYFDRIISATVDGIRLTVKSDFMLAKGILDVFKTPPGRAGRGRIPPPRRCCACRAR